jgi:shikimate dehydrogenase
MSATINQYGLIGYPLKNTFSEHYFTNLFLELELANHRYSNFAIEDLNTLTDLVSRNHLLGFNVTMPHKQDVIEFVHRLSSEAQACNAVNCVKVEWTNNQYELIGYNTDVYGFRKSLMPLLKPWHQHALILGTGGASQAVAYVLNGLGIDSTIVGRNNGGDLTYDEITKTVVRSHQLIIQTTPVGMYPNIDNVLNFPFQYLTDMHLVYDLIYLPEQTRFLHLSEQTGAITKNGLEMLHLQAFKSWQIWSNTNE